MDSATPQVSERPNLYCERDEVKRSGVEERTKPLRKLAKERIEGCKPKEFWEIYQHEANVLGFDQSHQTCQNYEFCGRYAEISSVRPPNKIQYKSHCCISCRDSKGFADSAMGHAVECTAQCGKLGAMYLAFGLAKHRKQYLDGWRQSCAEAIRRMDRRYRGVQGADKQVPEGWIQCSDTQKEELKAFSKGENDKFFPESWLMTADQMAEAQATSYTLSNVEEEHSSGNALGTGTSIPNAESNDTGGTGNVPNSAQGTGSSLTASSSTSSEGIGLAPPPPSVSANEEPPSARPEADEETADYEE